MYNFSDFAQLEKMTITDEEKKMAEKPKFSKDLLKYLFMAAAALTVLLLIDGIGIAEHKIANYLKLLGVFAGIPLLIYLCFFIPKRCRYHLFRTNGEQYAKREAERALRAQEESLLKRELPGYEAYTKAVKYRLFPFVW